MPKYIIERTVPGAGNLPMEQVRAISAKSNAVLRELGPDVQWQHSYVTNDKLYCVYIAKTADLVREHARRGGFPAEAIHEVKLAIDPTTGGS